MIGYVHSIEPFGTVDGPGIRMVVFLAGCRLGCAFCHNPDTWREESGEAMMVEDVLARFERNRPFYKKGGITVSGGEPLLQAAFVAALFAACREKGIDTALDTAGYAPAEALAQVLPFTDRVLFGLKAVHPLVHQQLTRRDNQLILGNLHQAAASKAVLVVRWVVIPGENDSADELERLAALLKSLNRPLTVELLPYHTMALPKWKALNMLYKLSDQPATAAQVAAVKTKLTESGIECL